MKVGKIGQFNRIVIKVGSALLLDNNEEFNRDWLNNLSNEIEQLHNRRTEILIVSSGAVAIGSTYLRKKRSHMNLNEMQAAAAMGQAQLVMEWQDSFKSSGINTAQILLTRSDTENKKRFLNSKDTLLTLIKYDVIPIINENDTVATEELRYGDNDRLAARVAQMTSADLLILLSDVDGMYTSNPKTNQTAKHIPVIDNLNEEIFSMADIADSNYGSGGMITKLKAAKIATSAGCATIVTDGLKKTPLTSLIEGGKCTYFPARSNSKSSRKQWLSGYLDTSGSFKIDDGAKVALEKGGSLLPVGLTEIEGTFERGDVVTIIDANNTELGKGMTAYSSVEAKQIIGCQSDSIKDKLGYKNSSEIVHRDDMVLNEFSK